MVISDHFRYLFIELPHTGSTAVSLELCEQYEGRRILGKHSFHHEFLRYATPAQRRYFVFSAIRNPLDETVSLYYRLRTDHNHTFTEPRERASNGGWVTERHLRQFHFVTQEGGDFATYLMRYYRRAYDNWSSLAHRQFDLIMRFDRLDSDFGDVLSRLGIPRLRPLPTVNATAQRPDDFLALYNTPQLRRHAVRVFGAFMLDWGFAVPPSWEHHRVAWTTRAEYHFVRRTRNVYRRWILRRTLKPIQELSPGN